MAESTHGAHIGHEEPEDLFAVAMAEHPELFTHINSNQMSFFLELCELIRPQIAMSQPLSTGDTAPETLPIAVQDFLQAAVSHRSRRVTFDGISFVWQALRQVVWQKPVRQAEISIRAELLDIFLRYGPTHKIGCIHFFPPVRSCVRPHCIRNPLNAPNDTVTELKSPKTHPVTVFTLHYGPLPAYTTSLYCNGCNTTYKHDYFVHDAASRQTYYGIDDETPAFIQSSKHIFSEWRLCEYFDNEIAFAWVSTTNFARVYNETNVSLLERRPEVLWDTTFSMTGDHVYDAFYC